MSSKRKYVVTVVFDSEEETFVRSKISSSYYNAAKEVLYDMGVDVNSLSLVSSYKDKNKTFETKDRQTSVFVKEHHD